MNFKEYIAKQEELEYAEWVSRCDRLLHSKIFNDLVETGHFIDDEIGDEDFLFYLEAVKESMTKTLWDCYGDHIGDILIEEVDRG